MPPERNAPTVMSGSAIMCLATESRITSVIRRCSAADSSGPATCRAVNSGKKYRVIFTAPPGAAVKRQPDSMRRTSACSVSGSGTYCSVR